MSGPVKRDASTVEVDGDGRFVHTFRQSWLNTTDTCLERARLELVGDMPRIETEAAAQGTGLHLGIEQTLKSQRDTGEPLHEDAGVEIALREFDRISQLPNFVYVDITRSTCEANIELAFRAFYRKVLPNLDPYDMEIGFGPLVLHEDDERVIQFTGTIDYLDKRWGLLDWKTGNRQYERWEKQRWAIQPTVYTWAAHQLGLPHVDKVDEKTGEVVYPFGYVVHLKGGQRGEIQWLDVTRTPADWQWLRDKSVALAQLIEADVPVWPKNDNHALCSPKWCPAWDFCKGRGQGEGLPEASQRDTDQGAA